MYKGHLNRTAYIKVRFTQSVEHRSPLWARIFHFIFCRLRRAPGRSTGPIQMKSSMTFIRGIGQNDHLKEKWRRYWFLEHDSLNKRVLALRLIWSFKAFYVSFNNISVILRLGRRRYPISFLERL